MIAYGGAASAMSKTGWNVRALACAALIASAPITASAAETTGSTPNDTARILAGLPPTPGSELQRFVRAPAFQQHSREFSQAWDRLESKQLAKIRTWVAEQMPPAEPTLFYFFSGPDFLYANAFYPNATTYVMSGLEPVGAIPRVSDANITGLGQLRGSLNTVMNTSFFRTIEMRERFGSGAFTGTLPILYIFLARSGKTVAETTLVSLNEAGGEVAAGSPGARASINGAKIVFSGDDGVRRTLYYFQTDVSNSGASVNQLLAFGKGLGQGDALIKSASYLLHSDNFSKVREFLLTNTQTLLQDDSGIPLRHFSSGDWKLEARGRYTGPINLFAGHYQSRLADLHRVQKPGQLPFGVGYRIRAAESSLLLATHKAH